MQFFKTIDGMKSSNIKYRKMIGGDFRIEENGLITGKILNTKDLVLFQGFTTDELEKDFYETVDFYLS